MGRWGGDRRGEERRIVRVVSENEKRKTLHACTSNSISADVDGPHALVASTLPSSPRLTPRLSPSSSSPKTSRSKVAS